jgi:release factor glutamine methyltransferase
VVEALVERLRKAGCVFAEDEARLLKAEANSSEELAAMASRRAGGEPLEHILGWAEFCGMRVRVGPGVFVPRRRTEFLVAKGTALLRPGAVVVDLCCGSGAISAALAATIKPLNIHAVDIDPVAVAWAKVNVPDELGSVYQGDLYAALPADLRGKVDMIVANAPYVPTEQIDLMPAEARLHEPGVALNGGTDGLAVQRRITAGAAAWLKPDGLLLIETSEQQAPFTAAIARQHGLKPRVAISRRLSATIVLSTLRGGTDVD